MNGSEDQFPTVGKAKAPGERQGRKGRQRSKTMSRKEIARDMRRERAAGGLDPDLVQLMSRIDGMRPQSRAECVGVERPCMWVACKYHLYLDVNPETGSIKMNFPDLEIWEIGETCALDVADKGGITLEQVGEIMNLTRERIRQVEMRGLEKIREATDPDL